MNEIIQHFHFLRPWWFLALIPALLCAVALWFNQKQDQQLNRIFNPEFLPFLLDKAQIEHKKWPIFGIFALWLATVVALAGPAWKKVPQPVERNTQALVIAWDMSPSMLAEDLKPSRLARSRLKLIDLLNTRTDGQVALIAYSGEAHIVTPLTDDYRTIINLLPALNPSTLPSAGSNPEMALAQAIELLDNAGANKGDILFLTDAIAPSAFDSMASSLRKTDHTLTIWGVGSTEGAPIPLPNGGFAKSNSGEIVIAKLNENELQQFASRQDGNYVPLQTRDSDIATLSQLLEPRQKQTERSERTFDQWLEHGQFLPLLLLPFIALFFRRGLIFSVLLMVGVGSLAPRQAQALEWERLWLNQDQRAQKRLEQGEAEAARQFTSPERRGAALYRNEAFLDAAEEFSRGESAEDAYNRGNALAHAGRFEQAIEAYDEALRQNPDLKKAEDNRSIAQQLADLAQQQEEQKESDQSQENQQGDQEGDKEGDQGEQSEGQNQPGEGGEQDENRNQESSTDDAEKESQNSGEQSAQDSEEMSDEQAQKKADEADTEQNPYSNAEQEQEESEEQQNQGAARAAQEDASQAPEDEQQAQAAVEMGEPQTEEEQMLEQWLRKVPDDPSGLMRNKFKYQHMQRQRQLSPPSPYSDNQAAQRW